MQEQRQNPATETPRQLQCVSTLCPNKLCIFTLNRFASVFAEQAHNGKMCTVRKENRSLPRAKVTFHSKIGSALITFLHTKDTHCSVLHTGLSTGILCNSTDMGRGIYNGGNLKYDLPRFLKNLDPNPFELGYDHSWDCSSL